MPYITLTGNKTVCFRPELSYFINAGLTDEEIKTVIKNVKFETTMGFQNLSFYNNEIRFWHTDNYFIQNILDKVEFSLNRYIELKKKNKSQKIILKDIDLQLSQSVWDI